MASLFSTTNLADWQEEPIPMLVPLNVAANEAGNVGWQFATSRVLHPRNRFSIPSTHTNGLRRPCRPDINPKGCPLSPTATAALSSPDGRNWTAVSFGPNVGDGIRTIYFDGTKFIGGGDGYAAGYAGISVGAVFTSTDGLTRTRRYLSPFSSPTAHPDTIGGIARIKKVGDSLVAIGDSEYKFMFSSDGVTWTVVGIPGSGPGGSRVKDIAFGNGVYVMGTDSSPALYTSPNAVTWTAHTAPPSRENPRAASLALTFWRGEFIAARGTTVYTSVDGAIRRVRAGTPSLQPNMSVAAYRAAGRYVRYSA
ncbi:MAG: hypothetical protein HZA32_18730 [Opitutae bacterium]|nr:hypothetical protein [Opitutae bacterium]